MAIPDGTLYTDGHLSAGTVERQYEVLTENAGADINFGAGVVLVNGKVQPATKAPIYGVALKRTYVNGDHFFDATVDGDHWNKGEDLGVLTDGTVNVPVSADVDRGELATVDADGNFKPTTGTDAVGRFLSSADKGSTARLLVRARFNGTATGGADPDSDDTHSIEPPKQDTQPTNASGSGSSTKNN